VQPDRQREGALLIAQGVIMKQAVDADLKANPSTSDLTMALR
jgi:hypothetical protein